MSQDAPRPLLQGWKEIATHLRTSPRTAQRWEAELDLPIKRQTRVRGAMVFADADALDLWQQSHTEEIHRDVTRAEGESPVQAAEVQADVTTEPAFDDVPPASHVFVRRGIRMFRGGRTFWLASTLAALATAISAIAAV